jgi:hypothetical protein
MATFLIVYVNSLAFVKAKPRRFETSVLDLITLGYYANFEI